MRQIKYRAWLKEEERMADVSDISFIGEEIDVYEGDSSSGDWRPFEDVELMQAIGVKDSNGKDIYEGDLVRVCGGEQCQGYWEFDKATLVKDIRKLYALTDPCIETFTIIGNIYENPELIYDA